jgi:hypothetical protein
VPTRDCFVDFNTFQEINRWWLEKP